MKLTGLLFRMLLAVAVVTLAVGTTGCSKKTTGTTTDPDVGGNTGGSGDNSGNPSSGGGGTEGNPNGDTVRDVNDIFFDYDDHTLSAEARSTLSGNANHLKEMSAMRLTIEGHCDERGTTEYNLALGQRRADAARSYLVDLGIDGSRLSTISYGEERPFAAGHDESSWSQNRRAHFRVNN